MVCSRGEDKLGNVPSHPPEKFSAVPEKSSNRANLGNSHGFIAAFLPHTESFRAVDDALSD
jgi:hypothetical protein